MVLKELKADRKPMINVLNKIDALSNPLQLTRYRMEFQKSIGISAKDKRGFEELLEMMMKEIKALRKTFKVRIPQSEYGLIAELMKEGQVLHSEYEENDVIMEIEIPKELEHKLQPYIEPQEKWGFFISFFLA